MQASENLRMLLSINSACRLVKTLGCKFPFNVYKENSNNFE